MRRRKPAVPAKGVMSDDFETRGGCGLSVLNVLTAMLVGLALLTAVVVFVLYLRPQLGQALLGDRPAPPTPTLVALLSLPGQTPQPAGDDGLLLPTWTPLPNATSVPLGPTNTRRPTLTPSITPTFPPPTPTRTPTATPTLTPTATFTPSPGPPPTVTNTRSPFPFTRTDDSPFYLQNFANNAGCNWLGIAGEVLDINGNPVPVGSYRVHVWGAGQGDIDARVTAGSAPAYGPSGWEQFIFNAPVVRTYNVQLETPNGSVVSQVYQVVTRASCNENLVLFLFIQNH